MRLVVDASVSVKLLVEEPDSDAARELAASGQELHAPRLMASEVANALWRKARLGQIERADAGVALAWLPDMPVHWSDDETVSADAVRLALALDHPVYDCVYLALAHRIGALVVTADRQFVTGVAPSEHGGVVVTLADYARTCTQRHSTS
ncbi:MAG: type II toxin-antitoxin system VapC family toxin [Alphaproteobacteria bacterium]|nr:type II toxin-antitoxin system VapC family toxin [Alphaproteobacteria bacterium]